MMKKLLFALFTILSFQIYSQSASDIATQAQNLGICAEVDGRDTVDDFCTVRLYKCLTSLRK